ncbi:carboxypeptidase family protein [Jatrophihabitans sp. GAS493]|uniref:carboxypeptidase-like regulatory domain-containing protein n=1 Tax=Jatrophihabitans sp. GAS493 TaxID=1907575 RepID=UPI000BB91A77|nr:carboxypeptidase-like regulatory domain-containing protein [Jatrophihabitans sp. GAS493]SOD70957.1 carboxypeptidase family protein [Jatrophihabitans sp. GAS493]
MRVATDTQLLEVNPGDATSVVVEIVNTGQVIDGVTARLIGFPDENVQAQPALLPLFPDASGQVTLSMRVPAGHPAGRHPLTVEVVSHGAGEPSQFVDVNMDVAAHPAMAMAAKPRMIRSRRQARFVLEVANEGNLPLEVTLRASDADRAVSTAFTPSIVRVPAGSTAPVLLRVKGPRMLLGAEVDRVVTVEAIARRLDVVAEGEPEVQAQQETTVRLRQRPQLSRGLITALILMTIIALWAGAFLLGITKVFSADPATKYAPPSFFAATQIVSTSGSGAAATGAAPAGALPKSGQVPAGIGGAISGTVTAASNHQPVGRILVEALRQTPKGLTVVSSAATQADGTYTVAGLFPTEYLIRFTSAGFQTVWYVSSPSQGGAAQVSTTSDGSTSGVNAVITGNPASISGTVDPGDTLTPVTTTVSVRSLEAAASTAPLATATTAADGSYHVPNLPAPGNYELTFTAPGYQPTTLVDSVTGGQQRLEPTVQLSVGSGQISGTTTSGGKGLGGVTVSTTVGGKALSITTPTTGAVGSFVLGGLPTPATYVITFARDGYGAQTTVIDLGAGQSRTNLAIALAAGTGSVSGRVIDSAGSAGIGGATVTVGGTVGPDPVSTTTLTQGTVGTFTLNGLAAPGSYTLTVSKAGYQPATVPVALNGTGAPPSVVVTLTIQLGKVTGTVSLRTPSGGGYTTAKYVGATVTATDGLHTFTTTSTAGGAYTIASLPPGTYSVTASASGQLQQTAKVVVATDKTTTQALTMTTPVN